MGRVKNPFVGDARWSVSRARLKVRYRQARKGSAILSKGGPTTSRLASLPRIIAVMLGANVQFRFIATGRSTAASFLRSRRNKAEENPGAGSQRFSLSKRKNVTRIV